MQAAMGDLMPQDRVAEQNRKQAKPGSAKQ
jgi:hypothetical protein